MTLPLEVRVDILLHAHDRSARCITGHTGDALCSYPVMDPPRTATAMKFYAHRKIVPPVNKQYYDEAKTVCQEHGYAFCSMSCLCYFIQKMKKTKENRADVDEIRVSKSAMASNSCIKWLIRVNESGTNAPAICSASYFKIEGTKWEWQVRGEWFEMWRVSL